MGSVLLPSTQRPNCSALPPPTQRQGSSSSRLNALAPAPATWRCPPQRWPFLRWAQRPPSRHVEWELKHSLMPVSRSFPV
eukprot:scaffold27349_cov79-Isochrysis_galbana.AAC.1